MTTFSERRPRLSRLFDNFPALITLLLLLLVSAFPFGQYQAYKSTGNQQGEEALELGKEAYLQGDYEQAMDHFGSARRNFRKGIDSPESSHASYHLAPLYLLLASDYSQALEHFTELSGSLPQDEAYYYFGLAGLSFISDLFVEDRGMPLSEITDPSTIDHLKKCNHTEVL